MRRRSSGQKLPRIGTDSDTLIRINGKLKMSATILGHFSGTGKDDLFRESENCGCSETFKLGYGFVTRDVR